jgi:dinuclear metal center YbgI/SA1388 family protein
MIVSHHPIIFSGLKRLTGKNYVERTVMMALKNDIALYALHTNLDNIAEGVNFKIGQVLGLDNLKILAPKSQLLQKLVCFVPHTHVDKVRDAMFEAGAGNIGQYQECSFQNEGTGSFKATEGANPTLGKVGRRHYEAEARLEFLVEKSRTHQVLQAMWQNHPYEEVAYDLYPLLNLHQDRGSGMIGNLPKPMATLDFLKLVKEKFGGVVRHTAILEEQVQKVAFCGGSGSFLLPQAKAQGAQVFISSDFKYHQFFDADNQITIADIGHFENEQYTTALIAEYIQKKFPNFAVLLTDKLTNPINYI